MSDPNVTGIENLKAEELLLAAIGGAWDKANADGHIDANDLPLVFSLFPKILEGIKAASGAVEEAKSINLEKLAALKGALDASPDVASYPFTLDAINKTFDLAACVGAWIVSVKTLVARNAASAAHDSSKA